MILIISEHDDAHVPLVTAHLDAAGAGYLWLAASDFPNEIGLTVAYAPNGIARCELVYRGQRHDLRQVQAVWHRREASIKASPRIADDSQRAYVELISSNVLEGLWAIIGQRWLPALPSVDSAANNKVFHAALAARLGFVLPPTLITNDPGSFIEFSDDAPVAIVSKSPSYRDLFRNGERCMLFTHIVQRRDRFRSDGVRYAPVIFQHYVPKRVELRVTVVGANVYAAEIDSQASRATRHDWRHYDDPTVSYRLHELPQPVQQRCVQLVRELGLTYGAIDLIVTPEGQYVFLEINSNGQWGWIEQMTGLPIASAIADWLVGTHLKDEARA